jgi:hypothetical protein
MSLGEYATFVSRVEEEGGNLTSTLAPSSDYRPSSYLKATFSQGFEPGTALREDQIRITSKHTAVLCGVVSYLRVRY